MIVAKIIAVGALYPEILGVNFIVNTSAINGARASPFAGSSYSTWKRESKRARTSGCQRINRARTYSKIFSLVT